MNRRWVAAMLAACVAALSLLSQWLLPQQNSGLPTLEAQTELRDIASPAAGLEPSLTLHSRIETLPDSLTVSGCQLMSIDAAQLSAQRSGIVSHLNVEEGDRVVTGQVLAKLHDQLAQASLELRKQEAANDVDLKYAKKVSDVARAEYLRAIELNREVQNAHSESHINALRMEAERALLQIEQAQNNMQLAKLRLAEAGVSMLAYQIRSPINGTVRRIHKAVGEGVHDGETVIEVASDDRLKVEADVPLSELSRLKRGQRVSVVVDPRLHGLDGNKKRADGKLMFVDSKLQGVSNRVRVWAQIDNRSVNLLEGMSATLQIFFD